MEFFTDDDVTSVRSLGALTKLVGYTNATTH